VEEGAAAGQPVVIGYDDRKASLLRAWLDDPAAVTFIACSSMYATPARAIASYWQLFEQLTVAGACTTPARGQPTRWPGWFPCGPGRDDGEADSGSCTCLIPTSR
jgi:hypothetical protein